MNKSTDYRHLRFIATFREEYSKIKWEDNYEKVLHNLGILEELLEKISDEIILVMNIEDQSLKLKLLELLEGMTRTINQQQSTGLCLMEGYKL